MDRQELQKLIVGVICPLPTPFDDEFRVDNGRMYELSSYLVDQGLATGNSMLKVASAVGEGPQIGDEEWPTLLRTVVQAADGKCPVMHSIHHKDTFRAIEDAKKAADLGAVGLQVSPPLFNDPNQDDMVRYFEALSDAIDIGVMIYNNPWYTHTWGGKTVSLGNIEPNTFVRMADFEHIVSVKWSVPEGTSYEEMSKFASTFNVIDNNTDFVLCHKLGGAGYIGIDPVFPKRHLRVWELLESKRYDEAQKLHDSGRTPELREFSARVMQKSGGMARINKGMWEVVGQPVGPMRPPSLPLTPAELDELRQLVKGIPEPSEISPVAV